MAELRGYKELPIGAVPFRLSTDYKTGDWRALRPIVDHSKCVKCMLCWIYCPDMAVIWDGEKIIINYDYCKGCGLCAHECPVKAITMEPEPTE